jgi:cytidine deaminase
MAKKNAKRGSRAAAAQSELIEAAEVVRNNAYAPYSKFRVGAAVRAEGGAIASGCNVENASYGLSLCAERSAVAQAVAAGAQRIEAIAIASGTNPPTPPCGMCLQTLAEFGSPKLTVILSGADGSRRTLELSDLLPHAFTRKFL